ncbi:MAG TPA: hypothetical protein VKD90_03340 [Gemmataceae bacterium]|nr:hypothetical protein [Gemmataceae bacterium]
MAFLTACPACGNSYVCSLAADAELQLKCRKCRSEYPAARRGVLAASNAARFEDADTLAEADLGAIGAGRATLVVVRHLPSRYPKRRKHKRRRHRKGPPIEVVAAALLAPPEPAAPVEAEQPEPEPAVGEAPAPGPLPRPSPKSPVRPRARLADDEEDEDGLFQLRPAARLALLLTAAALLAAAVAPSADLVRPLATAGLMTGLYATRTAWWHGRRLMIPGWVTGIAAVVLLASFVAPGLLGPRYRTAATPPPAAGVQIVPYPIFAGDPAVRQADWVDAGKAGLRQGIIQVQVIHVWIGPPPKVHGAAGDAVAGDRFLCVRVRVHRFRSGPELGVGKAAPAWADPGGVTLTDAADRVVARQPGPGWERSDDGAGALADAYDTTLLFAVPPAHPKYLRLELSGPGWGGPAPLRFQIPGSMIGYAPPRS